MGEAGSTAKREDAEEDGPAITLKKQAGEALVILRTNAALADWRSKDADEEQGELVKMDVPEELKHVTNAEMSMELVENNAVFETSRTATVAVTRLPATTSDIIMKSMDKAGAGVMVIILTTVEML